MIGWRRVDRVVHPRTIRARIAISIVLALVITGVGTVWAFERTVESAARADVERGLHGQAHAIAGTIDAGEPRRAAERAREARAFIGDLRMVVSVAGEVVYFSGPRVDVEAAATAREGDVSVRLERPDAQARAVGTWRLAAFVAGSLAFVALIVWYLSGTVTRRLRRAVVEVAESAEAVTDGRFDVRVAERQDELARLAQGFNRMTERLEAADARQREFLADIAHELRTPVTTIEGFAGALVDGTARDDADRLEAAAFIRDETARLAALIRDLHTLTWLDLDPPADAARIDLSALAREAVARHRPAAREKRIALSGPERPAWAIGDPAHVATILANLLANALAATPPGGSVALVPVHDERRAGMAVSDTGRGIAPEHLPYVFDRLYRADASRERGPAQGGGSGLGLPIVRRLAALQDGTVTVSSAPGHGATFTLWLPAARG